MPLSSELTLAPSPRAAAEARRWVGDVCHRLGRTDLVECAELGVSELVANAILHATAPYLVRVRGTASHPRIEVVDGSTHVPVQPREARVDDEVGLLLTFGRGLAMVSQCAVALGATIETHGKIVWFEPAAEMHEDVTAEWVIDRQDEETPELTSESAMEMRLLDVDMALFTALSRQYSELRRELRLLSLSHQADYPLAGDLTAMFTSFERQFPDSFFSQTQQATAQGRRRVDLVFPMVPEAQPILSTMTEMFDVADAFCRAERLLSMARTTQQREFHNWMLRELIGQLEGAPAHAWPSGGSGGQAESASQVG